MLPPTLGFRARLVAPGRVTLGPPALLGGGKGGARMLPFPGVCPRGIRSLLSPPGRSPTLTQGSQEADPAAGRVVLAPLVLG